MSRIPSAFRAVALLLVLIVLPRTAEAGQPPQASKPDHGGSVAFPLSELWSWLNNIWEKNGCMIDPDSRCLSGAAPEQPSSTENGCGVDPGGRCSG